MEGKDSRGVRLGRQVPAAPGCERRCLPRLLLEGDPQEAVRWENRSGGGGRSLKPAAFVLSTLLSNVARPLLLGRRSPVMVGWQGRPRAWGGEGRGRQRRAEGSRVY